MSGMEKLYERYFPVLCKDCQAGNQLAKRVCMPHIGGMMGQPVLLTRIAFYEELFR